MELAPMSENASYVKKLEEKLREYAKRLRELEDYRSKSEQPSPYKQQINKLKAENDLLKRQLSNKVSKPIVEDPYALSSLKVKIAQLEKEKIALEESLRGEILMNEEQRNYIEMLKEALEARVNDLGIKELIGKCKAKKSCDIIAEIYSIKKEVDAKRKEVAEKESKVANAENIINTLTVKFEELKQEREKEKIEGREILKKEREEKELFVVKESYAKNEANKLGKEVARLNEELGEAKTQLTVAEDKLKTKLENEIEIKTELKQAADKIEELTQELNKRTAEIAESKEGSKIRDAKINELQAQVDNGKAQMEKVEKKREESQRAFDQEVKKHEKVQEELNEDITKLTEALNTSKRDLETATNTMKAREKEISGLKYELNSKAAECTEWVQKYTNVEDEYKRVKAEKEYGARKCEELAAELKSKDQRLADSHSELERVLDSFAELDEKYKALVLDYDTTVKVILSRYINFYRNVSLI